MQAMSFKLSLFSELLFYFWQCIKIPDLKLFVFSQLRIGCRMFKKSSMLFSFLLVSLLFVHRHSGASEIPSTVTNPASSIEKEPHSYFFVGNPEAEVTAPKKLPTASFVLMGGGPDVDPAFRWMISRAGIRPGTGGRFVIIRATGTDAYNPYIFYSDESLSTSTTIADEWVGGASLGLSSVETLVIPNKKAANNPEVLKIIKRANAVFIAGGDQSDYIKYWKGTKLENAINKLMENNIPIGGTSAGLAVLGQFDYSALYDSVTSDQAMKNPFNKKITLNPDPLSLEGGFIAPPELAYMIFDSHFDERDRMGRLITFISRIVEQDQHQFGCPGGILRASTSSTNSARGIGIGVETALLVQGNGPSNPVTAQRVTNVSTITESAVYFVRPSVAPSLCAVHEPLTIRTVEVKKLADSRTIFNLSEWGAQEAPVYKFLDVNSGSLVPSSWY